MPNVKIFLIGNRHIGEISKPLLLQISEMTEVEILILLDGLHRQDSLQSISEKLDIPEINPVYFEQLKALVEAEVRNYSYRPEKNRSEKGLIYFKNQPIKPLNAGFVYRERQCHVEL